MSNNVINFLLFSRKLEEPSHATNIFNKRALVVRGCNTLASRLHTSENSKHACVRAGVESGTRRICRIFLKLGLVWFRLHESCHKVKLPAHPDVAWRR